jgi:tetratricopeptide (TPR) repeat protein
MTIWTWARPFNRHKLTFLAALTFCSYGLIVLSLKLWVYPGWTWKGFLSDLKSVIAFGSLLTPLAVYYWIAKKGKKPEDTVIEALQRGISLKLSFYLTSLALMFSIALASAVFIVGERDPSVELQQYISDGDWSYEKDALTSIKKEPLRPDVLSTIETYARTSRATAMEQFGESDQFREYRKVSLDLLRNGYDLDGLNTLSYAEASRAIFLIEAPASSLDEACQRVLIALAKKSKQRAVLLAELGELRLAAKDYVGAQTYFQDALRFETRRSQRSVVSASLGNAVASQGNVSQALKLYEQAEADYPEGRKFIYYSNYGYLLLRAKDYDDAEIKIKRAIGIRQDDWISHLNLGLVYDARGMYDDAAVEYQHVVDKAGTEIVRREGLVLMGRSAELAGRPFETYVAYFLQAAGRAPSAATIQRLKDNMTELRHLYHTMALQLRATRTHGIEEYIDWFEQRSNA